MTAAEAVAFARAALADAGVERPDAEAWWLLEATTTQSRTDLLLARDRSLTRRQAERLRDAVSRRSRGEPLQHIVGAAWFYGLELRIDARALVPRPETERLVELALEALHGVERPRVLDVGTGSGAVAVAIAAERPDAEVMATDVSAAALALAAENVRAHAPSVRLVESDLLERPEVQAFARRAHALVANPPYLPESDADRLPLDVRHDPPGALFAGPDGLDVFRPLVEQAATLLPRGALLLVELDPRNVRRAWSHAVGGISGRAGAGGEGAGADDEISAGSRDAGDAARGEHGGGWSDARVERDLTGRERFLVLRR